MKTLIKTIPHSEQRYDTCGNYQKLHNGATLIEVSDTGDADYNFLIALHELVEQYLVEREGIDDEAITRFDIRFEFERKQGLHAATDEPGDSELSPYRRQHFVATNIERIIAGVLGVDWSKYEKAVSSLDRLPSNPHDTLQTQWGSSDTPLPSITVKE